MIERNPYNPENKHNNEAHFSPESYESSKPNHNIAHKESKEELLDSTRTKVEQLSNDSEEIRHSHNQQMAHHERPHHYITKQIKQGVYYELLAQTRTRLSKKEQAASKFIHNDAIEKISEVSAKTIARPNQILGGGLVMVIGGIILLLVANKSGFELPLSSFFILYAGGYLAFLLIEFVFKILKKSASKPSL